MNYALCHKCFRTFQYFDTYVGTRDNIKCTNLEYLKSQAPSLQSSKHVPYSMRI